VAGWALGPGYERSTLPEFREYLKRRYWNGRRKRRFGFESIDFVELPPAPTAARDYHTDPLYRGFLPRQRAPVLGRQFGASVLQYTGEPAAMAESLALGANTLGYSARACSS
jgi:hypothetical protein